jgi:hypothetical protein
MKISFCFFILLFSLSVQAQIRDRASVTYQGMSSNSGESGIAESWISERWFLDEEGNSLLQVGLQTRRTELAGFGSALPDDVWMVVPQANYLHSINEKYSILANLRAGAFSDFQRFGSDDLRVEGAIVLDRIQSDQFTWGLGLGRVSNFGRVIFVPLVHIIWTINEKWLFDAMLPGKFDLLYMPSSKWELGLSFNIIGSRYAIESDQRKIDGLGVGQMNLGPQARYQIAPSLYVTAESGLAFARRLSLMDGNTEITEIEPNNEAYLRCGLQYRF